MKQSSHCVTNTQYTSKNGLQYVRDYNKNGNIGCVGLMACFAIQHF